VKRIQWIGFGLRRAGKENGAPVARRAVCFANTLRSPVRRKPRGGLAMEDA
jgi:hypothetical protein